MVRKAKEEMITYHCVFCGHEVEDTTICEICERDIQAVCQATARIIRQTNLQPEEILASDIIHPKLKEIISKYFWIQQILQNNFFGTHSGHQFLQKWPIKFVWRP